MVTFYLFADMFSDCGTLFDRMMARSRMGMGGICGIERSSCMIVLAFLASISGIYPHAKFMAVAF